MITHTAIIKRFKAGADIEAIAWRLRQPRRPRMASVSCGSRVNDEFV